MPATDAAEANDCRLVGSRLAQSRRRYGTSFGLDATVRPQAHDGAHFTRSLPPARAVPLQMLTKEIVDGPVHP
jgi:hypothetical protein